MLQSSYEPQSKDLWVFIETKHGKARNVGLELLNPGRRLAAIQGGKTVGLVIGYKGDEAVKEAFAYGADKVIVMDNEVYDHYSTDAYTAAIVHAVEKNCPYSMLMGASPLGRDLGPRVAGRLKTGLTADCTSLDIDEESGRIAWTRPAFGGNLMATILCPFTFPQLGTCRPGVNKKMEPDFSRTGEIEVDDYAFPADQIRIKVLETIEEEGEKVDLEGADIIVSGGSVIIQFCILNAHCALDAHALDGHREIPDQHISGIENAAVRLQTALARVFSSELQLKVVLNISSLGGYGDISCVDGVSL